MCKNLKENPFTHNPTPLFTYTTQNPWRYTTLFEYCIHFRPPTDLATTDHPRRSPPSGDATLKPSPTSWPFCLYSVCSSASYSRSNMSSTSTWVSATRRRRPPPTTAIRPPDLQRRGTAWFRPIRRFRCRRPPPRCTCSARPPCCPTRSCAAMLASK